MPVVVKGKAFDVPAALREQATRKVSRRLTRYFDATDAVRAEVSVGFLRGQYTVEVTLQLGGVFLRGVARAADGSAALDEAVERAERQFLRFKSRLQARSQGLPSRAATPVAGEAGAAARPQADEHAGEESPQVVRTKRFALKPMSVDEAVLQMEMLGHDFFVFTNATTDEVNVLYRRRDGNYGLIEPDR